MIRTFPRGAAVLWREPFHGTWVPGVVVTPHNPWMLMPLVSVRLHSGLMVCAQRETLVRR